MVRPLIFILPSLILGAGLGFFVGRWQAPPAAGSGGQSAPLAASQQNGPTAPVDGPSVRIDYDRLAAACARGATKGNFAAPPAETSVSRARTEAQREAQRELLEIEERALREGEWSEYLSVKAQDLFGQLSTDAAAEFAQRINERIKSGALVPQAGAWLPAKQEP